MRTRASGRATVPRQPRAPREPRPPEPSRSAAEVEAIVDAYQAGATLPELARTHGCSTRTIRAMLDDAGVAVRRGPHRPKRLDLPVDELVRAYGAGDGLAVLALRYDTSPGTIRSRLVEAGVTIRKQGDRSRLVDEALVVELYNQGATCAEIGAAVELSESAAADRLRKLGLEPRGMSLPLRQIEDAVAAYVEGTESVDATAERVGIGPTTLRRALRKRGIAIDTTRQRRNGKAKKVLALTDEQLRFRYAVDGQSMDDIAVAAGCSAPTIRARLVALGVTIRAQGTRGR